MGFSWENKILVTIPTYNEKLTIRKIVEEIFNLYPKVNVCIVDDNSPDGTAEDAQRLTEDYNGKVFLINRRGKFGRGSAVIEGLKFGLKQPSYEFFMEMDSDFSHQPEEMERLMEKSENRPPFGKSTYSPPREMPAAPLAPPSPFGRTWAGNRSASWIMPSGVLNSAMKTLKPFCIHASMRSKKQVVQLNTFRMKPSCVSVSSKILLVDLW